MNFGAVGQPAGEASNTVLGLNADVVALFFTVLGALFVLYQVINARRTRRLTEVQREREWGKGWAEHRDGWALATIAVRGPSDYYALGRPELRALVVEMQAANSGTDWDEQRGTKALVEEPIRAMLRFLDSLAQQVVSGRLSARVAYTIVGTDIVRSSAVLRSLVGHRYAANTPPPDYGMREGASWLEAVETLGEEEATAALTRGAKWEREHNPHGVSSWLNYYPGMRIRLLVLLDVLWAEACRRGELSTDEVDSIGAMKKATNSGLRNRARLGPVCAAERGRLASALTTWRLRWLLLWSEFPAAPSGPDAWSFRHERLTRPGTGVRGFLRRAATDLGSNRRKAISVTEWLL